MLKGEKLDIRMARKDFVALFVLYIYISLSILKIMIIITNKKNIAMSLTEP